MHLVEFVNRIVLHEDKVCVIGENMNINGEVVRRTLDDFLRLNEKYNVVVLNNVRLTYDRFKDLIESAKDRVDVLVCDLRSDRKRKVNEPWGVYDATVEFYDDLGKISAALYQYPFLFVHGGMTYPSYLAIYFRRMLPVMRV
jgi:hypothetical protein